MATAPPAPIKRLALALAPRSSYDPRKLGAKCDACPLQKEGHPVPPTSPKRVDFIIIGEGPGRLEERMMAPFVGPSGGLLDRHLQGAGLNRARAHVTNAVLCRLEPDALPEVKLAAVSCCSPRLAKEIENLSVPILVLGAPAARSVLGVSGIQKSRGFVWTTPEIDPKKIESSRKSLARLRSSNHGRPSAVTKKRIEKKQRAHWLLESRSRIAGRIVIPSVHPAFILRGADGWLPVMANDFKRFKRLLDGGLVLEDEVSYDIAKTPEEIRRMVGAFRGTIAVDVETKGEGPLLSELLCVGLSDGKRTVVIFPWGKSLAPSLKMALSGRTIVMHYGIQFDQIVLRKAGVLP